VSLKMTLRFRISHAIDADEKFELSSMSQCVSILANWYDWEAISTGWRNSLDLRIAKLHGLRDQLGGCIGCGCLSLDRCAIFNGDDTAGQCGVGAVFLEG
jgi:hypothetical protein